MKIVVDENIEFGLEAFRQFGNVTLLHGRKITNESLKDVEILIVRSITNVNEELLRGTAVRFVGSTTIGVDHIETDYLNSVNIKYASAPGCNSFAVVEYVLTALAKAAYKFKFDLAEKTLGVIGYGNIGCKLTRFAKALRMKVLVNDPPLERDGFDYNFSTLDDVLHCDIVTLHVPMNKSGIDKTYHLLDEERISKLRPNTILINTSRGAVIDNTSLLKRLNKKNDLTAVLDVWENEPAINHDLLRKVYLGTPHIAGYTYEGKINGTQMIYEKLCEFLNINETWQPKIEKVENDNINLTYTDNFEEVLFKLTSLIYDIETDSKTLKSKSNLLETDFSIEFDLLRKHYNLRREFPNYKISSTNLPTHYKELFTSLRFNIQ